MAANGSKKKPIAHVRRDAEGNWAEPQGLEEHLLGTAKLAKNFAEVFNSSQSFGIYGIVNLHVGNVGLKNRIAQTAGTIWNYIPGT